jgi:dTDP-4-dehydrorhamnose reductase
VFFTPILIQSLVDTVLQLLEKDQSGIFNVVGDERITKYEFGLLLAREFNLDSSRIRAISFSDKPGLIIRPLDLSLSNKKTRDLLGRDLGDVKTHLKKLHELESNPGIINIREIKEL